MMGMFYDAIVFNQNIGNWNIDLLEDMSYMFANAQVFNQDLSIWNPVEVTTMNGVGSCGHVESIRQT